MRVVPPIVSRTRPRLTLVALCAALIAVPVGAVDPAAAAGRHGRKATLATGTAPDGSGYRWLLYKRTFAGRGTTPDGHVISFRSRLSCLELRFREHPARSPGALCGLRFGASSAAPAVRTLDARFMRAPAEHVAAPGVVVSGATDARVAAVRVVYTEPDGAPHDLPVNFAHAAGLGLYTAFVPGDWAARDRLADRERARRPGDPSLPPTGALDLSDLTSRAAEGCDPGPAGPLTVIAYDADGRRLNPPAAVCARLVR